MKACTKEKIRVRQHLWYEKNKESAKQKAKCWVLRNPERRKKIAAKWQKEWRKNNIEEAIKREKEYHNKYPEKRKEKDKNRYWKKPDANKRRYQGWLKENPAYPIKWYLQKKGFTKEQLEKHPEIIELKRNHIILKRLLLINKNL